jgi:hypothetical protein
MAIAPSFDDVELAAAGLDGQIGNRTIPRKLADNVAQQTEIPLAVERVDDGGNS